jgi:hypothetical protein
MQGGNYWLRAFSMNCANNNYDGKGTQNAIIHYTSAPEALPTTTVAPVHDDCLDEPAEKTVPFVGKSVDVSTSDPRHLPVASPFHITSNIEGRVFRWSIGKRTQNVDLQHPSDKGSCRETPRLRRKIISLESTSTIHGRSGTSRIIFMSSTRKFYPHLDEAPPCTDWNQRIHMHGNDLRILASGEEQWNGDVSKLEVNNQMRRETFMLRGGGYAILAFYRDNPGVWLLHCHIGWQLRRVVYFALCAKG